MRNHIIHGFPFTRLCAAKMIGAVWLFRNFVDEKSHRANNFIALAFDKGRLTILKSMACSKLKINYNDDMFHRMFVYSAKYDGVNQLQCETGKLYEW